MFPAVEIVTASEPEIVFVPDQEPDAEQEVALVEDQVIVEALVRRTVKGSAEIETVGAGVTGAGASPLPPPPHPDISIDIKMVKNVLFLLITLIYIIK